jgi:hypothetical protein
VVERGSRFIYQSAPWRGPDPVSAYLSGPLGFRGRLALALLGAD